MNKQLRFIFAFLLLFLCSATFAQKNKEKNKEADLPAIRLNHMAIYVYELKKATEFYENVLGLKQIPEPFHDGRHTWFTLGPAGHLHLIQGAEENIKRDKNDHLCFSVKSVDNFIAVLNKNNIEYTNWPGTAKEPTVRVDGVKQVYFQDPDGHWIEINDDKTVK